MGSMEIDFHNQKKMQYNGSKLNQMHKRVELRKISDMSLTLNILSPLEEYNAHDGTSKR